jgi:hypothetical protein
MKMSWASRRRAAYGTGVFLFFLIVLGGPVAYWYLTIPATCHDGIQNQNETSPDHGGPCVLLDANALSPAPVLWSRSFRVRDGSYNSVAYIQNTNEDAGALEAPYRLALYDTNNVLIAEKTGTTFIMPSSVTPVFVGGISTGNRFVVRTFFELRGPLTWMRMKDLSHSISINDKLPEDMDTAPRVTATAFNSTVDDITDVMFVATVFDAQGNAFASSQTKVPKLRAGEKTSLAFTWPDPFGVTIGRIDVIPLVAPVVAKEK